MTVKIEDHGFNDLKKKLQILDKTEVKVGILGKSGSEIVNIAGYQEFGTSRIQSRPFMRLTFEDNKKRIVRAIQNAYTAVQGGADVYPEVNRIGLRYKGLIQRTIGSNIQPQNALSTIRQKKSSRTLIDTGRMRQSVDFEVK